jgi:hypothetical protein
MTQYPTSFGKEDLIKCAQGELFGEGNAQLPMPPMLMMDRITEISGDGGEHGKGHVIAEFDIDPSLWSVAAHGLQPWLARMARARLRPRRGRSEANRHGPPRS